DQAASIQRRVTTCGGRRKTQPTVRDGLTTTKHAAAGFACLHAIGNGIAANSLPPSTPLMRYLVDAQADGIDH
ncbi:hypothetical protein ACRCP7_33125, partial [Pseudomonas aeruginosa]